MSVVWCGSGSLESSECLFLWISLLLWAGLLTSTLAWLKRVSVLDLLDVQLSERTLQPEDNIAILVCWLRVDLRSAVAICIQVRTVATWEKIGTLLAMWTKVRTALAMWANIRTSLTMWMKVRTALIAWTKVSSALATKVEVVYCRRNLFPRDHWSIR